MFNRFRGVYMRYAAHHKPAAAVSHGLGAATRWLPFDHGTGLRFLRDALGALPAALCWYLTRGPGWKAKVKTRLGLTMDERAPPPDPQWTQQLIQALGKAAACAEGRVPIYLAHSLGGGADQHLKREIDARLAKQQSAVVLRFGGALRVQVELCRPEGRLIAAAPDLALTHHLLAPLTKRRIIYSCAVGDSDPLTLPQFMLDLAGKDAEIEIRFHDYFPVSPSYCLLDKGDQYRGPVTAARSDPAHQITRPDGNLVCLPAWQAAWRPVLKAAARLLVYSNDSHDHVVAAFPELSGRISITPHMPTWETARVTPDLTQDRMVIGVLGNIAPQKGAALICDLAHRLRAQPHMSLALIGTLDPAFKLPRSALTHGPYHPEEIAGLARRYGITCWLIPSIWPETFSFTTHEALATGLPVMSFDIGAQGDATARAPNGYPISFMADGDLPGAVLDRVRDLPCRPGQSPPERCPPRHIAYGHALPRSP
ncbi:hypothetical protein E2K80_17110 [Rhodophyticola sp. CCM32]|uniref:hypothetical protein n=1 Tax=Rhodophyticola sp. CCM32 TaxID=2916397 RepID=UPI00107FB4DC|nr:hypothetical protein [Rhodophyticola sp. CCM32]QBY02245.1 hypothetical protein E2K80_17110 [Rhodophyticola sp. CCM32]